MKRYFIYIIMVLATLVVGCTPYATDENPQMTEIGDIEVAFSVDGEEVSRLDLASVSHNIKVDVALNNEGVYWNAVSSEEWCQIVEEEHRGSGSFTLVINANDNFDARETATVTFKAGEYEQDMLTVDHSGNVFVIDQVYTASTKSAGSFTTKVKTFDAGEAWHIECDPWITATKGTTTTDADGIVTTEVTISWQENSDVSRYGSALLVKDGKEVSDGAINIWQFGTELNYDADGNLLLAAEDVAPLELRVPKQIVKEIVMPTWVTYTITENADSSVSYMLQFTANPSDAQHIRVTELELTMLSGAANIKLPVIKQEYYNVDGLLTGPGLALFAKTWNEGGDVSQWYIDGVPTIVGDVDMTEIKEWTPIGTAERPWTGEFNGNGKKIINFKSSTSLFGYCKDAEIKGLIFDSTSAITIDQKFGAEACLSALAYSIEGTTISECINNANITLSNTSESTSNKTYLAGLVGKMDSASTISSCTNNGKIRITAAFVCAAGNRNESFMGGLAAISQGTIQDSFNSGSIIQEATVYSSYMGGIVGQANGEASVIRNNINAGTIENKTPRSGDAGRYARIGGITSLAAGEITENINDGDITLTSDIKSLHAGGIVGEWNTAATNATFENNHNTNAADIMSEGKARYVYLGGLIGYVYNVEFVHDFANDTGVHSGTVGTTGAGDAHTASTAFVGGIIGYSNQKVDIKNVTWEGKLKLDPTAAPGMVNLAFGGIIGSSTAEIIIENANITGKIDANGNSLATKSLSHFGGVVGIASTDISLTKCVNSGEIGWTTGTAKSNGIYCITGGMVGSIYSGDATIIGCESNAKIEVNMYNNNEFYNTTAPHTFNNTGGIVGAYGYSNYSDGLLTVKDCTANGAVESSRGSSGGIVGYAHDATIDNCSFTGRMSDMYNAYAGGIIAVAEDNVTVTNCSVKSNLSGRYTGSMKFHGGGIAAILLGTALIENCEYYGIISRQLTDGTNPEYFGGIAAYTDDASTVIRNCRYGGTINNVVVSSSNIVDYASDIKTMGDHVRGATIESVTYWDGK